MHTTERDTPPSVIGRVSLILSCFSHRDVTLTVSEIARRTGLPKSTTSRLVAEMTTQSLLDNQDGAISPGLRLFSLGEIAARPQSLRRLAYPRMEKLRSALGHTIHLAVLDGKDVVYVEILPSRTSPALPSRIGGRVPAHATGVGKALLAYSHPDVVDRIISGGLESVGPRSIVDPDALRGALWRIRSVGIATEHEESGPGIACVAAPILDDEDRPLAAMSISGWVNAIDIASSASLLKRAVGDLRRHIDGLAGRDITL